MRFNILGGLLPFKPRGALKDAFAGLTLASMNIPQVLGYTRIAGTPIVTGLYTVLLPLVAFALFGSSRHLVVAADSATAAIFSSALSRMAPLASDKYMALVGMLTLMTAGLLLLARIFKLGFLADFLSRTVLVGFLTGVGIQVGIAMLGGMLGVNVVSHRTLDQLWALLRGAPSFNAQSTGLSIFVVASILLGRRFAPRFPVSLVVVVGTIAASAWLRLAEHGFAVIGPVPGGLPSLKWPDVSWRETLDLLPGRRVMFRHDHRAKCSHVARLCYDAQRARRRERGYWFRCELSRWRDSRYMDPGWIGRGGKIPMA
jgi:SulP family sulfate permease